jgi:ankyrin repeat protein
MKDPNSALEYQLYKALNDDNLELARFLLNCDGINVNWEDINHWTPLMLAIPYGDVELIKALIVRGADVNVRSLGLYTPLLLAMELGKNETKTEIVAVLKAAGAKE